MSLGLFQCPFQLRGYLPMTRVDHTSKITYKETEKGKTTIKSNPLIATHQKDTSNWLILWHCIDCFSRAFIPNDKIANKAVINNNNNNKNNNPAPSQIVILSALYLLETSVWTRLILIRRGFPYSNTARSFRSLIVWTRKMCPFL